MNIMYMYGSKISATSLEIVPLPAVQTNKQYLVLENWKKKLQMSIKMAKSQRCVKNYSYYAKKKQKNKQNWKKIVFTRTRTLQTLSCPSKGRLEKPKKAQIFYEFETSIWKPFFVTFFFILTRSSAVFSVGKSNSRVDKCILWEKSFSRGSPWRVLAGLWVPNLFLYRRIDI